MMNGINGSGGCLGQMQMQGMRQKPSSEEKFNKLDADGNGGIDQAELQTMADKIANKTGEAINVEETSATYDANNDGLLNSEEMQSMMMELRDKIGGQQGGVQAQQAAYQPAQETDLATLLMDMLGEQAADQEEYTPLDILA